MSIKSNLGKTRKLIKQVLNKVNKTDPLHEFRIDNKFVNDKDEIANTFNFFTNIGPNLTNKISSISNLHHTSFLNL